MNTVGTTSTTVGVHVHVIGAVTDGVVECFSIDHMLYGFNLYLFVKYFSFFFMSVCTYLTLNVRIQV